MTAGAPIDHRDVPLLVVSHVDWEGPHRVLEAFAGVPVAGARPLDGDALPDPALVRGAVLMGGPMSANDTDALPGLADEIAWLEQAVAADVPVLGVCLGAQLLARAVGGHVRAGAAPEIGWAPVDVFDAGDPVLGPLAPRSTVLHWHGEVIDLPDDCVALARSEQAPVQAFRHGHAAWGLLFHAEADVALVERWLDEPSMADEAIRANGPDAAARLRAETPGDDELVTRSARSFAAFAALCGARAHALATTRRA